MSDRPTPDPGDRLEELLEEHRDPPVEEDDRLDQEKPFDPFAPIPVKPDADTADADTADADKADEGVDRAGDAKPTTEDRHALPDAPLFALLRNVESEVGTDRIDRIWVFPLRRLEAGETAVVVVAAFTEPPSERRRVYAAHYTAREDAAETRLVLDEFGTAPTDRVGRMVEEVVERVKDGPAGAPRSHAIDGREDRWNATLHQLAKAHLAATRRNPRLRP